ncbi:MAG: hypothetical protein EBT64_08700 [Gammaproteobacteria bacterium]|nr:hypothetical protein [Gammaproteobacteria bacterium]
MAPPKRRHWMTLVAMLALGVHAGPAISAETSSLKLGTEVDWDQRFGLPDSHRFRLDGLWRVGKNVYLDAQLQYFSLTVNDIAGSLSNRRAALIWQSATRWGVGVGFDAFEVEARMKDGDFRGTIDWAYRGPQAIVNYTF